jgi:hypothetical protein
MTLSPYQEWVSAADRRDAVADAIASVQAEGLEFAPGDLALFDALAAGELSAAELRERLLTRYAA